MPESDEYLTEYKKEMAVLCSMCGGTLAWKKSVVPNIEGEYSHVSCTVNSISVACDKCGNMFDSDALEDEEGHCPECYEGMLKPISRRKVMKVIVRTTLAEYEPDIYDVED